MAAEDGPDPPPGLVEGPEEARPRAAIVGSSERRVRPRGRDRDRSLRERGLLHLYSGAPPGRPPIT
jgi:hypothetical protein